MTTLLVLGGARSGKSAYAQGEAERMADSHPLHRLVFIATAEAGDPEMQQRIERHRADRDARWRTIEAPYALAEALRSLGSSDVAVVDCLTLWLTNIMLAGRDLAAETAGLNTAIRDCPAQVVLVSNEVGLGIVPDNVLARNFRDAVGRLHQQLAASADRVVFIAAGLSLVLKPQGPA